MSHSNNILLKTISVLALTTSISTMATEYEITPYLGITSPSDLTIPNSSTNVPVDNSTNYGIGFAWQESPNGQGQILINYASHEFKYSDENLESSFEVLYAHFNGIAQFKQRQYITTISVGLGAARFSGDGGSEVSPSLTAAIGTRYELSDVASIVTEIRGYASLMQDGNTLFCQNEICAAEYDDTVWIDTSISIGFSYRF
jgi:hypothetical protein